MNQKQEQKVGLKIRVKAFTLVECLAALLVLSSSLMLFSLLSRSLFQQMHGLRFQDQDKWLLFVQQMRAELNGSQLQKVQDNYLYVTKNGKALRFGQLGKGDFRKSASSGKGYNPMLLDLKATTMTLQGKQLTINLEWRSGLRRTFYYAF
ncbi:competence type IV pilus minor pilin ComGF [Streptococcus halichoeri]|uniref:competence type IV pilus minor pilin ComGF n=1 Tax=Streptococcus halichoeri TaxID=254785 RepID=UPI001356D884|nr:competence type IV pilus minor pilin ComGF [Streptococcus halichoeri]